MIAILTRLRLVRPFRIGKHKATQPEFDAEVLRLYKIGLSVGDIGRRLRRERTTIWRSLQRTTHVISPEELTKVKEERAFYLMTNDEFTNQPLIKEWIEDMKARRVGGWKDIVLYVKHICDDLQIFADQLDLDWGKKWLALKSEVSLEKLRQSKIAVRGFFKAQGSSDYELTQAGFDAKHYGVGKWKHVKLTEDEIGKMNIALIAESLEAQFAFTFGLETCRTLEPIWNLKGDQFYTIEWGTKTLYAVNIFRRKTEKAGAAFKTAYVSKSTFDLAKHLSTKNGETIMNGFQPKQIYVELRRAYKVVGITNEYFYAHPIHALRHCGAQRLLEKTNFNRAVVAELGGWEAEKTLEDHYGGVPEDIIRGFAASIL